MVMTISIPKALETPSGEEVEALKARIAELKRQMNAIIVVHNYQRPEIQDIGDFVGDSLELSRKCAEVSDIDVIVFCGVDFMAETAKIVNPSRTVLLSDAAATCPMAAMIDEVDLREWKARYPDAAVVCYVNTTAAVKAESDICCTSANAVAVVNSLPNDEILFVPDQHLAHWVSTQTTKRIIGYPGYCITHQRLRPEHILQARRRFPDAPIIVHPECAAGVVALADAVLSTSQMARYVRSSPATTFLVGTEMGLVYRMQKENPDKTFYLLSTGLICPNMKRTTLPRLVRTMEQRLNEITIPEDVRVRAVRAIDRMLAIG